MDRYVSYALGSDGSGAGHQDWFLRWSIAFPFPIRSTQECELLIYLHRSTRD